MIAGQQMKEDSKAISSNNYSSGDWYNATVPGTVLTTLVNEGMYPIPLTGSITFQFPIPYASNPYASS